MGRGGAGMTLSIPTPRPVVDPPKFVCKEWGKDSPQGSGSSRGNSVGEYPCGSPPSLDPWLKWTPLGLNGHL
ncbi:hypothetical protein Csa_011970 [Cucumis sativus]|uniref:Uncharacterized protein n=1 Tax=Cucumis sativus TaxID=3659 RepID=A0A0A0KY85_CUCSA|nr:hypothetical protein Csa_011970 [Cucumis sativus]